MTNTLSIITINYNNAEGLLKTIESVLVQTFKDFEYIIIDGGSTDESIAVIDQHKDHLNYWVSEPDEGIYNAMNKGLRKAKGDYVLFMNSGDFLYNANVLKDVFSRAISKEDLIYGDVMLRHEKKNWERLQKHPEAPQFSYFYKQTICQQACFIKRNLFDRIFYLNEDYKICADWEFLIYAIYIEKINFKKIDVIIANYDMQGVSSTFDYREIAKRERQQTIEKYFPLFKNDYETLSAYSSNRHKQLKEIESSPFLRKIVSLFFKCCLFVLPRKKN